VEWIHLAQDMVQWRGVVQAVINPTGSIKGREFLDWLSDY
jgi:hypothetical protein